MLATLHTDLRDFRDSIQHADERFGQGRVPDGDPVFPAMTNACVYFAGQFVFYGEVAALIMTVWELAAVGIKAVTPG